MVKGVQRQLMITGLLDMLRGGKYPSCVVTLLHRPTVRAIVRTVVLHLFSH